MSHKHFCDVYGHEWECGGTALRHLRGETEPSVCMCIRHRVPMEEGDHSECSIELLACPEHREEQIRRMEEGKSPGAHETDVLDGWDELFRPMTPAELLLFDAKHRFMEEVVYAGLENINTGFDSPSIFHFSPTDFNSVIDRCEGLGIHPNGIEVFTTEGGFIDCVFAMDDGSSPEGFDWARRLVQRYLDTPNISMCATFNMPESLLKSSSPSAERTNVAPNTSESLHAKDA